MLVIISPSQQRGFLFSVNTTPLSEKGVYTQKKIFGKKIGKGGYVFFVGY
jgi:hypothetical protein